MTEPKKGLTPIFILVVMVVLLFVVGIVTNILMSDGGSIFQTKQTVQISQEQHEELTIEVIEENENTNQ